MDLGRRNRQSGFFGDLERAGRPIPRDFRLMTGIAFVDTIVLSRSQYEGPATWRPLLFHELVHVVQYRILGVDRYVSEYVNGWARYGFFDEAIPLERMAYELQGRFDHAWGRFSAESEVVRALQKPSNLSPRPPRAVLDFLPPRRGRRKT